MKTISLQEKYNREQMDILLEVIDENEMRQIGQTFSEINRIIGNANLPSVKRVVSQASQDISGLQSRGVLKQLLGAVTLNIGQKRVMSSIVSLQTQLISLFRSLPDLMAIAGPIIEKTMQQEPRQQFNAPGAVKTGKAPMQTQSLASALKSAGNEGNAAYRNLEQLMKKALEPDAIAGLFNKYKIDAGAVTKDVLELTVGELKELSQRAGGAHLQVPVAKEDLDQLRGAEEKTNPGSAISQITPDQAESYMQVLGVLEKMGQKINPDIKKALASRLKAGRDQEQNQ